MGEKQPSKWKEILLKILYWVGEILTVFIAGLSVLLALSVRWMFATWTNLSMDELVYHLTAPLDGTNTDMIWDYVRVCAVPTILVIFFLILILIAWRKKEKVHLFRGIINLVALVGIIVMLGYTWTELGVGDYLKDQNTESKFIEDEYVDPTDVEVVFPEQKRNLIYIFLESMETTYSDVDDGGAFDENVIPELTEIAQTNEDFSGADPKLNGGYSLARGGAAQVYGIARKLAGTADNKETTRNDMAIMMIDRMSEVGNSDIWTQTRGFKNEPELDTVNPKTIVRQGRNVSQLHNVLRRGLDADMPELINAPSKAELRKKIAASFGQE